jgi:hypothetical protein
MFKWINGIKLRKLYIEEPIPSHLKKYKYISLKHDMYHFQFDYSSTLLSLEEIIKLAESLCMNPAIRGRNIVIEIGYNFEDFKTEKQHQIERIALFASCLGMTERIEFGENKANS